MKKIYLLIVLCCMSIVAQSQTAADYSFTATTGTYTSISSAAGVTSVSSILCDDCTKTSIPIGFTFKFCGTNYTQLSACSNGWISLANSSSTGYQNMSSFIPGAGYLMPFWRDFTGVAGGSVTPSALYLTTGTSPNRVFTFEWKDYRAVSATGIGNFQVKLYETSNIIEFVYGSSTAAVSMATIGIANSTTDWQTLPNSGASPVPSSSTFTSSMTTLPASGQIYRWQAKCWGFSATATINGTTTSGCATYGSTLSLSNTPLDEVGLTYQWKTSPTSSGPWTSITGATTNTYAASVSASIYYTCQIQCSYSSIMQSITDLQLVVNDPAPISGPDTACIGTTITLADATPGGAWSSSNTSVAVVSSGGVVAGVSTGPVTITYTTSGCSAIKNIYVNTLPSPGTISGSYYVCAIPTAFTATVTGGVWGVTNTSIAGVSTAGAVFAIAPGLDTVTYAVTNGCGTSTATYPINTTPCLNGIEPVNTIQGIHTKLYPNPTKGVFTMRISSGFDEPAQISITNVLGRQIKQLSVNTNSTLEINCGLTSGVYLISVNTSQGTNVSRLVVE